MPGDGVASRFDSVSYTAATERMLDSVLAAQGSTRTRARAGAKAGGGLEVTVNSTGNGTATVAAGLGVITDTGAGAGSYLFAISTNTAKTLGTRPTAGQSRLDWVVAQIKNVDERPGDGAGVREVDITVYPGTATAGTPAAPSGVPSGVLLLAELVVPASGTISVQKPAQRTVALGGVLPVASSTERDAIEVIYDGLVVYREDTDVIQIRAAGAWVDLQQKVDTGWSNVTGFVSGFSGETGRLPKKRTIRGNEVKIKGRVNGTFGASASIPLFSAGAFPSPPEAIDVVLSGHSQASSVRALLGTDGSLTLGTGASAPVYVVLDGLSGYMLD